MFTSTNIIILLVFLIAILLFYIFAFRIKWREILPLLFDPLIQKIPPYISPNQISLIGFLLALITGLFVYLAKYNFLHFLWAAVFMSAYAIVDNLDGILARARNQVTKSGSFLDYTLDKLSYLVLLYALILGEHVRTELVVISMLCSLFYALINMESQALTGSTAPLAERPRWLILAIILCVLAFLIKFLGAESFELWDLKIRTFDALFVLMPIYQIITIFSGSLSLWQKLKKLDQEEYK